jgi:hypothetical protein
MVAPMSFWRTPVKGPGEGGANAGPPQLGVPAPIVNSMPPRARKGGAQPATSVVVDELEVVLDCDVDVTLEDVVVGTGEVLVDVLEVLVVVVVVGRGGQAPGADAFRALNFRCRRRWRSSGASPNRGAR